MNSMVVDENSFKLDDISGSVHTTHKLNLRPFESATVTGILKGPVKNSVYHKRVNVSIEPLEAHKEGKTSTALSLAMLSLSLDQIESK